MSDINKTTGNKTGSDSKSVKSESCGSQKEKILKKEEKVLKALEDENLKIERFYVQLDNGTKIWTWKVKNSDSVNQLLPPIGPVTLTDILKTCFRLSIMRHDSEVGSKVQNPKFGFRTYNTVAEMIFQSDTLKSPCDWLALSDSIFD